MRFAPVSAHQNRLSAKPSETGENKMTNCEFCETVSASDQVCTECGEPLVDNPMVCDEWDGQPDEAQEWHDFDPDC